MRATGALSTAWLASKGKCRRRHDLKYADYLGRELAQSVWNAFQLRQVPADALQFQHTADWQENPIAPNMRGRARTPEQQPFRMLVGSESTELAAGNRRTLPGATLIEKFPILDH